MVCITAEKQLLFCCFFDCNKVLRDIADYELAVNCGEEGEFFRVH
ncbi:hypothetical protein ACFL2R_02830 [Patescibacteria group bacterium]